ncbi:hypothetical protein BC828DRAFT_422212 [Blastocladiella britannica]|nr:hypothetical protein BC828DRAFT_422212 [Blastocladiella britannica]
MNCFCIPSTLLDQYIEYVQFSVLCDLALPRQSLLRIRWLRKLKKKCVNSCTTTATACSVAKGCISGCKSIPDPGTCSTQISPTGFTSPLYPQLGATDTTPAMAPTTVSFASSGSCSGTSTYALQPCDLVDLMGGAAACPNCLYYYDRVREAIEAYGMSQYVGCSVPGTGTGARLAAFMATLRHETAALGTLFQPLDGGAGGIHMIPANFQAAAAGIPRLADALTAEFGPMATLWTQIARGNTTAARVVGNVVMRPEHAFLTVGWWFVSGAQSVLAGGCADLRGDADLGLGTGTSDNAASGFYKVSRCVFGTLADEGLAQRVSYYKQASAVANAYSPSYTRTPPTTPTTSTPTPTLAATDSGATLGVTIGSVAGAILVLALGGMALLARRSRRTTPASVEAPPPTTNSKKQSPSSSPAKPTAIVKSVKQQATTKVGQSQEHLAARRSQSGHLDRMK